MKKIRADVDQELAKEYQREVQEETGETEEEKRIAKRRAEDKRRALLSPEEQRRVSAPGRPFGPYFVHECLLMPLSCVARGEGQEEGYEEGSRPDDTSLKARR